MTSRYASEKPDTFVKTRKPSERVENAPRENAVGRAGQRRVLRRHKVLLREVDAGRQVLLHDLRGLGALACVCGQRDGAQRTEDIVNDTRNEEWKHTY